MVYNKFTSKRGATMNDHKDMNIYGSLLSQLNGEAIRITDIQIGKSWVITSLSDGRVGMAAKLYADSDNNVDIQSILSSYSSAQELALQIDNQDVFLSTLALSAINAMNNSPASVFKNNSYSSKDTLCTAGLELQGKTIGIIGHMKRTYDLIRDNYNPGNIYMFDMDKSKGDLPPDQEPVLLPTCDVVIITATTLINHTITDIISWTKQSYNILYGPSAPLVEYLPGINRISGFYIKDPVLAKKWNQENKGSPLMFSEPFMIDVSIKD